MLSSSLSTANQQPRQSTSNQQTRQSTVNQQSHQSTINSHTAFLPCLLKADFFAFIKTYTKYNKEIRISMMGMEVESRVAMELTYIKQPEHSGLCGQACVAMLANASLDESIAAFGKRGGTTTKDVVTALRTLGVSCGDGLTRLSKKNAKSNTCIVVLRCGKINNWHWVVYHDGLYYDPDHGIAVGINEPHFDPTDNEWYMLSLERRETSFLQVNLT